MAFLTQFFPQSPIRTSCDLRSIHVFIALCCFGQTVVTICVGLQEKLGSTCSNYVSPPTVAGALPQADLNPSSNYQYLQDSCKIGNGLALTVLLGGMLTGLAVFQRGKERLAAPAPHGHDHEDKETEKEKVITKYQSSSPRPSLNGLEERLTDI